MKVKDVNVSKIDKLLRETPQDMYIVNITFQGNEPVLNLYKPYDDNEALQEKYNAVLSDLMGWINELDKRNNFV